MSIDQTDKIDFMWVDSQKARVVLIISDHLDWEEDEGEHLLLLQVKLNAYLGFIESGQMLKMRPDLKELPVTIQVNAKFPLNEQATKLYRLAGKAIANAGYSLELKVPSLSTIEHF